MPDLNPEVSKNIEKPSSEKLPLPKREELPEQLIEITDQIAEISGTWNPVEIYTADEDSIENERKNLFKAFISKEEHNPTFTYSYAESLDLTESRKMLAELQGKVRQFKPASELERLARVMLHFKIADDIATCDLQTGIKEKDERKIAKSLRKKYPSTDPQLLHHAKLVYEDLIAGKKSEPQRAIKPLLSEKEQDFLSSQKVNDQDIKEAFEWALDQYGILRKNHGRGFVVLISEKDTDIDVRDKSKEGPTVFIPKGLTVTMDKLLEYMAHEIEGHARQSVNGEELFIIGGGPLKIDNEMLYEGLGKRYDEQFRLKFFGTESGTPLPYYTYAIKEAEEGTSFYKIFGKQVQMRLHVALKIPPEEPLPNLSKIDNNVLENAMDLAWRITYRVMRGHTDTSNQTPFAMAKDLAYLRGWLLDKELVKENAGYLNEAAVVHFKALKFLAEFDLSEEKLPIPFKDIILKYWQEVIRPQMLEKRTDDSKK